jgi:hypothetical protein
MAAVFGWQELQAFKRLLILIYISQGIPYNFDPNTNPKLLRSHFGSLDARVISPGRRLKDVGVRYRNLQRTLRSLTVATPGM